MATYLKARSATVVPMDDMRHVPVNAGEVVDLDKASSNFRESWESGDPWLQSLFEETSEKEARAASEYVPHEDPVARAMEEHEELVRARAALPIEERVGADTRRVSQTDRFRTLPTSGADLVADHRFAEGGSDTSESLPEEAAKAEEERRGGTAGDRELAGGQAAVSTAPNAATPPPEKSAGKSTDKKADDKKS